MPLAHHQYRHTRFLLSVNNLSVSYYRAGDFQNAFQYLEEGIKIGQQRGEVASTAFLIGNKGVLLTDQGKYSEAINFLNQGIAAAKQSGNGFSQAYFLASLGFAEMELGEYAPAINDLNQALQVVPAGSNPEVEGKILSGLIIVYAVTGDKVKTSTAIRLAISRKLDATSTAGTVQALSRIESFRWKGTCLKTEIDD